jgi:hypothetical protein
VAEAVGMDPIEFRILNAYRDGDMKAHRRLAKNTALIECCQVAAEKAKWQIGREALAASSLRGGGGERAAMPARTATDTNGTVQGYTAGKYAQKARETHSQPPSPQPAMPRHETAPVATAPQRPSHEARYEPPRAPDPTPAGPAPRDDQARVARFSSISGLRRR